MNTGAIARKARAVILAKRVLLVPFLAPLASLGAAGALGGCQTTPTPTLYTPITGIVIHASDVVAGRGCGQGADQVYRYAVIVFAAPEGGAAGAPLYAGVFDCYEDGVFENLPYDAAVGQFSLRVLAYTKAGFPPGLECTAGVDSVGNPCALENDAAFAELFTPEAEWETTCTATEQPGAPVFAVCGPVEPADAGSSPGDAQADSGTETSTDAEGESDGRDEAMSSAD